MGSKHWRAKHWRAKHWRANHWSGVLAVVVPTEVFDLIGADPTALIVIGADPAILKLVGADPAFLEFVGADPKTVEVVGADPSVLDLIGLDPSALALKGVEPTAGAIERRTEAEGEHAGLFSPSREYFLDTHSTTSRPPVVDLRAAAKQNDLKIPLTVRLRRGDGSIPDITGLADDKFEFNVRLPDGSKQTFANATVDDVPDARIIWPLDAVLAAVVAEYGVEVEVNHPDPATETFPVCDQVFWVVHPEIG